MKTISKILCGTAAVAVIGFAATTTQARTSVSVGFGYHSGYPYRCWHPYRHMYYYAPPPVVYAPPPPPPAVYSARAPQPAPQRAPVGLADVKALTKAGLSDEVIISQIRASGVVYRLTAAELIDLKETGVSERVLDFMVNTASR